MPEMAALSRLRPGAAESCPDWIVIGAVSSLQRLAPLEAAHAAIGRRVLRIPAEGEVPVRQALAQGSAMLAPDGAGILVVEPADEPSLRTALPHPLATFQGAPVGFLRLEPPALAAYAERASVLLARPATGAMPLALLGPREWRYLTQLQALAEAMRRPPLNSDGPPSAALFSAPGDRADLVAVQWSADRLRRRDLMAALRSGPACALYAGHGNRSGWLAYGGLSLQDLLNEKPWDAQESIAFLASLACGSGAPGGLADVAVRQGMAGVVLAPMSDPLHDDNCTLAKTLVRALAEGQPSLGSLLRSLLAQALPMDGYVLVGDPGLAPRASVDSLARCLRVVALPPDAMVPTAEAAG